ncbi:MAG: LysM domain-containing protein [Pseudomonadota bacterium]
MRKYLINLTHSHGLLLLIILMFISACTVTPTQETNVAAEESAEPVEVEVVEIETVTTVTEVDIQTENLPTPPEQNNAELLASAPEQYTVQKGDTLWGISRKFLDNPWYWPEIWYMNPQVQNPHLIYPGDVINVFYVGGRPYLTVERPYLSGEGGSRVSGIERLSPEIRTEPIEVTEKIIPIQAIEQFLIRPQIVDEYSLESAPHIVGSKDNRIIYGANDSVYVRDSEDFVVGDAYSVYRKGAEFTDPVSGELLGYQATHIADGEVTAAGNPATVYLSKAEREVLRGDRLISLEVSDADTSFRPHPPTKAIYGEVIHLFDAITQVGTHQIVVTNLGARNGIEKGNVVNINHAGRIVEDRYADSGQQIDVKLPDARAGDAIIFRTFDKLSYAFILDAKRPIKVGDIITNPE